MKEVIPVNPDPRPSESDPPREWKIALAKGSIAAGLLDGDEPLTPELLDRLIRATKKAA